MSTATNENSTETTSAATDELPVHEVNLTDVAAGAGPAGVGVVDGEPLLRNGVLEVDAGTAEVRHAHLVDDDLNAVVVTYGIPVKEALVEVELVDQTGATARLHGDAEAEVGPAFLLKEAADLACGNVGQLNLVGRQFGTGGAV
jgi:hypothetical protein